MPYLGLTINPHAGAVDITLQFLIDIPRLLFQLPEKFIQVHLLAIVISILPYSPDDFSRSLTLPCLCPMQVEQCTKYYTLILIPCLLRRSNTVHVCALCCFLGWPKTRRSSRFLACSKCWGNWADLPRLSCFLVNSNNAVL